MPTKFYAHPPGGMPDQAALISDRAVFTESYAFIPKGVMRDSVTSYLPHWEKTRLWVVARPMTGFAETFSQYIMEVEPDGGSDKPDPAPDAEAMLFLTHGSVLLTVADKEYTLKPGGYAYVPANIGWMLHNVGSEDARFHWIRKRFEFVQDLDLPETFAGNENDLVPGPMVGTSVEWTTTHFIDPADLRHDMQVNIVTFEPGAVIPFAETHVMEHGLYVLQGKAVYRLNSDWVEVEAGDYMWLRAFCPQACYAGGPEPFRYLLYKDVNRHADLGRPRAASLGPGCGS